MSKEAAMSALQATIPTQTSTPGGSPGLQPDPAAAGGTPTKAEMDSTRFAHIAKKEAELVKQRDTFKKEHETFLQEKEKMREIQKQLNDFNETKAKDPVAAMKLLGFSETDLFNFLAAQEDNIPPEERAAKAAQSEIQKFRDEQAAKEQEAINKRNDSVVSQFKQDISKTVLSDKDKYEYCNYNGPLAEELIYETVAQVYELDLKTNPDALPITAQEAADMVESYYEEEDKAMSILKKRQPKPSEEVKEPVKADPTPAANAYKQPPKTLSSKTAATVASTITRKETHAEKRARLANKLANLGKS